MKIQQRIVSQPVAGIPDDADAPFWRGETAGKLVRRRAKAAAAEKATKAAAKAAARGQRTGATRVKRERTPNAQLRRLERALARRKTLAARQRIQQQLTLLREQLAS